MGTGHAFSGMLRRGRLRRHDLPQANWLEGFTSKRTSHLLGMCPTRHAVIPTPFTGTRPPKTFDHGARCLGTVEHEQLALRIGPTPQRDDHMMLSLTCPRRCVSSCWARN